jgi:hypothetical protein
MEGEAARRASRERGADCFFLSFAVFPIFAAIARCFEGGMKSY